MNMLLGVRHRVGRLAHCGTDPDNTCKKALLCAQSLYAAADVAMGDHEPYHSRWTGSITHTG